LTNIRMRESVEKKKAKTANLFVRREVFETIGLFPEGVRSGGDVRWTRRAVDEGYVLCFCQGARVWKAARPLRALLKKQWRVAKGQPAIWKREGRGIGLGKVFLLAFLPFGFAKVKKRAEESDYLEVQGRTAALWGAHCVVNFIMRVGQGYTLLTDDLGSEKEKRRVNDHG